MTLACLGRHAFSSGARDPVSLASLYLAMVFATHYVWPMDIPNQKLAWHVTARALLGMLTIFLSCPAHAGDIFIKNGGKFGTTERYLTMDHRRMSTTRETYYAFVRCGDRYLCVIRVV